jgi:hypothetical protein
MLNLIKSGFAATYLQTNNVKENEKERERKGA